MLEENFEIGNKVQIHHSLAKIERSINSFAAEQRDMYNLVKELRSGFTATRDNGTDGNTSVSILTDKLATLQPDARKFTQAEWRLPKAESSLGSPKLHQSLNYGSPETSEGKQDEWNPLARASNYDTHQSRLDPCWPVSLRLRPAVIAIECRRIDRVNVIQGRMPRFVSKDNLENTESINPCIILPASRLRTMLDLVGLCLLAWDLTLTPVQLAWNLKTEGLLHVFAVLVSSFWTLDMLTYFRTAFHTSVGELETRPRRIAIHYLRHAFAIDFLIVTCDWGNIIAVGLLPSGLSLLRVMKLTRLLRILRMINLAQFERVDELIFVNMFGIGPAMLESIKILAFTIWITHVICCAWFAIGKLDATDTGLSWLDSASAENAPNFADSCVSYQYTSALQWSLTTMLSGTSSILPLNSAEQVVSCLCILVGLMVQAFVVSVLSSAAVEAKAHQRNQTLTISLLNRFCSNHRVSVDLVLSARSQVKASFGQKNKAALSVGEVDGLLKISSKLRMNILREVFEPNLSRHALLVLWSEADKRSFLRLTSDLMALIYAPREHDIFVAGDAATGMYLLSKGIASYSQTPDSSKMPEQLVHPIPSDTWVCEPALWMEWLHVGTMETDSEDCEVHALRVDGFSELVATSTPAFKQILRSYAILFYERATHSVPPAIPWPSDIHTHGTNFVQMILAMHEGERSLATTFALHYAIAAGIIDEAQSNILLAETQAGKAILAIVKTASCVSVQRVLSVARVIVSRVDGKFYEIGKFENEKFCLKVQLPGAKQRGSEDIFATVRRVTDTLKPILGDIQLSSTYDHSEILVSNKVNLNTHYIFFDACFVQGLLVPGSTGISSGNTMMHKSSTTRQRPWRLSQRRRVSVAVTEELERRMLSGDDVFLLNNSDEEMLGMWLREDEVNFLKSLDGIKFVESIVEKGGLTADTALSAAPSPRHRNNWARGSLFSQNTSFWTSSSEPMFGQDSIEQDIVLPEEQESITVPPHATTRFSWCSAE